MCGSEADTSVIRRNGAPLGKTSGGGEVDAAAAVAKFMGNGATAAARFRRNILGSRLDSKRRALLDGLSELLGGGSGSGGKATEAAGTKTPKGTVEDGVAKSAGKGAESGLPTVGADGVINMVMHQVSHHELRYTSLPHSLNLSTLCSYYLYRVPLGLTQIVV